jgi:hypothetical protein
MNSQKFILSALAGLVVYFLLGWLVYGVLLQGFMKDASPAGFMRAESDMVWWALVLGNLAYSCLLTYLIMKTGTHSITSATTLAFTVGILFSLSVDLMMYATTTLMTKPTMMIVDVLATSLMSAITGAAIEWVREMGKKPVAVA